MTPLHFALAVGMGVALAVYLPLQGQIGRLSGSPILASVAFYCVGALTSLALAFAAGHRPASFAALGAVPPWMFVAGVVSALMILGTTYLIPRIGPGPFFVLLVAGQVLMGAIVSHFGLLEAARDPLTLRKLAGLGLVVGGTALVSLR